MPDLETARHKLPFLAVAQAQKEITHNEALVRIDALLHPVIEGELPAPPALSDANIGNCWIVAASPTGEWAGKTGQIAVWVGGSWRFCVPAEGMRARLRADQIDLVRLGGAWVTPPSIPDPANGTIIDAEARTAVILLLQYLRTIGHVTS